MKIISLSILSITLSLSLFARENPFEPTDHFLEQKEIIIKANEEEKLKQEQEKQEILEQELESKKLAEIEATMKIAQMKREAEDKLIADKKEQEALLMKQKEESIQITKRKEEAQSEKISVKNTYIPEIKESFQILPFINIYIVNDVLTIKVDKQYKLLNQDILKPAKKLLFDFQGKKSFYTIRKEIISDDFKSFAVGTHMKENFFRVVIDLPNDVINYIEKVDSENGIITIMKKK